MSILKSMFFRKTISLIIFLGLLVWIIYFIKNHWSEFQNIRLISREYFFIIFICVFVYFLISGIILKSLLEIFNLKLSFREWFGITMVTLMGNYLLPFGGFGFRAAYLKKVYGFRYTHFMGTLGVMYLIEFPVFGLGGLVGLAISYFQHNLFNLNLLILFIIVILGCGFLTILAPRFPRFRQNKYLVIVSNIFESLQEFKKHPGLRQKIIVATLAELVSFTLIFYFTFRSLGFRISLGESLIVSSLSDYAFFVRLLPASFGSYEGAIVYTARLFGLNVAQGLAVAVLSRIAMIFWVFTLGLIFGYILLRKARVKNV